MNAWSLKTKSKTCNAKLTSLWRSELSKRTAQTRVCVASEDRKQNLFITTDKMSCLHQEYSCDSTALCYTFSPLQIRQSLVQGWCLHHVTLSCHVCCYVISRHVMSDHIMSCCCVLSSYVVMSCELLPSYIVMSCRLVPCYRAIILSFSPGEYSTVKWQNR